MSKAFVVLWMLFFHIVDDFYLQGWLASAKQKKWWEENAPDEMYRKDYVWALLVHGFSWAFMVMLPLAYYKGFVIDSLFLIMLVTNALVHAWIDDEKANKKSINLWQDQFCHMIFIAVTAIYGLM